MRRAHAETHAGVNAHAHTRMSECQANNELPSGREGARKRGVERRGGSGRAGDEGRGGVGGLALPAVVLVHGSDDTTVPTSASVRMFETLQRYTQN